MEKWNSSLSRVGVRILIGLRKNLVNQHNNIGEKAESALEVVDNFRQELKDFFVGVDSLNNKIQTALENTHREL